MVDEGYSSLIDSLKCYTLELYFVLLTSLKRSPSVLESTGILVFSSCNLKRGDIVYLCFNIFFHVTNLNDKVISKIPFVPWRSISNTCPEEVTIRSFL